MNRVGNTDRKENAIHPTEGLLPLVVIAWSFLYLSPSVAIIVSSIIWGLLAVRHALTYRWQDITLSFGASLFAILSTSVTYWVGGDNKTLIQVAWLIPALVCYATEFFLSKKKLVGIEASNYNCRTKGNNDSRLRYLRSEQLRCHRLLMFIFAFTILLFLLQMAGFLFWLGGFSHLLYFAPISSTLVVIHEFARHRWLSIHLHREQWLPILNLSGEQVGLMARSQLCEDPVLPVCLPAVRVLAVCRDMVYLEKRASTDLCSKGGYDTPFYDFLTENTAASELAKRLVYRRFCGIKKPELRYLLHYTHEGVVGSRYIYLFIMQLESPDLILNHRYPHEGKWWAINLIKQHLHSGTLAPCLEEESPYICHIISLAEKLRHRSGQKQSNSAPMASSVNSLQ
ncbi:MAG: hypothetical protein SPI72_02040 [Porphyromonas sp.]|nr:hypothetical protein [Porphyromonas sp.]